MRHLIVLRWEVCVDPRIKSSHLRVLYWIGQHADRSGRAYPSMPRLAERTGFSVGAVHKAVKNLAEWGYLKIQQRARTQGGVHNVYWLNLEDPIPGVMDPDAEPESDPEDRFHSSEMSGMRAESHFTASEGTRESALSLAQREAVKGTPIRTPILISQHPSSGIDPAHSSIVESPEKTGASTDGAAAAQAVLGNGKAVGRTTGYEAVIERGRQALKQVVELAQRDAKVDELREQMVALTFAYWAARLRHPNAFQDPKRERVLRARLKENRNDINELLYVIDGARRDKNLMGENERGRAFDGIETLFRDRAQVERLSALAGYRHGMVHPQVAALTAHSEDSH